MAVFTEEKDAIEIIREAPEIFAIQKFDDLPLYIAHQVLDEGDPFYCGNKDRFYRDIFSFVREWKDLKPRYREYLEGMKQRGWGKDIDKN